MKITWLLLFSCLILSPALVNSIELAELGTRAKECIGAGFSKICTLLRLNCGSKPNTSTNSGASNELSVKTNNPKRQASQNRPSHIDSNIPETPSEVEERHNTKRVVSRSSSKSNSVPHGSSQFPVTASHLKAPAKNMFVSPTMTTTVPNFDLEAFLNAGKKCEVIDSEWQRFCTNILIFANDKGNNYYQEDGIVFGSLRKMCDQNGALSMCARARILSHFKKADAEEGKTNEQLWVIGAQSAIVNAGAEIGKKLSDLVTECGIDYTHIANWYNTYSLIMEIFRQDIVAWLLDFNDQNINHQEDTKRILEKKTVKGLSNERKAVVLITYRVLSFAKKRNIDQAGPPDQMLKQFNNALGE